MPSNPTASLAGRTATGGSYDLGIEFSAADQAKLIRLMQRLQTEMGHGALPAVKWAAWYVAQSLAASTRKSKTTRAFVANPGTDPNHPMGGYQGYFKDYRQPPSAGRMGADTPQRNASGWWPHWVKRNDAGTYSKLQQIKYSGLAKESWVWIVGKLGKRVRSAMGRHPRGFQKMVDVREIPSLANPAVILTNRLHYIREAVRYGGARGIETAMSRGATAGLRYLDRRLAKATR